MRTIYDFGSNNGDDIPYYLKKAERVVAVEANPVLCAQITARFASEISSGRLVVEGKVLTTDVDSPEVNFYVHKANHVLSQFPEPANSGDFEKILLPSVSVLDIVRKYGDPYYIKLDIEHYDQFILRALFGAGIRPPFISAESHSPEIFAVLVAIGGYNAFKFLDGRSVPVVYRNALIEGERYSFPLHSAGPFGDDIEGPWLSAAELLQVLAVEGLGWKDIHASNCREPLNSTEPNGWDLTARLIRNGIRKAIGRLAS